MAENFTSGPPPIATALPRGRSIREVYDMSRTVTDTGRYATPRNPRATIAVGLAVASAGGLALVQQLGLSYGWVLPFAVGSLVVAVPAFRWARDTGGGTMWAVAALVLGIPLAGFTVGAFVGDVALMLV